MAQPTEPVSRASRPHLPPRVIAAPPPTRVSFAAVLRPLSQPDAAYPERKRRRTPNALSSEGAPENRPVLAGRDAVLAREMIVTTSDAPAPRLPRADHAATPELERVFSETVSRIAWSGASHTPLVHIQLAHASLAGSELLVERSARGIRVRLSGVSVDDRDRYRGAIERRLRLARVAIDEIDVE